MGRLLREEDVLEGLDYGIKIISDENLGYNYMRLLGATREMVKNLPTAYDVEAVIQKLKENAFSDYEEKYVDNGECIIYLADAIEIVKGGVK